MTLPQLAEYLRVSYYTALILVQSGKIKSSKNWHGKRGDWVINSEDIKEYLDKINHKYTSKNYIEEKFKKEF